MKFTTPCFVRVEGEEEKTRLITWILDIGNSYREDASGYIIACLGSRYENVHQSIQYSLVENLIDCGTDIELFKALAAMNDKNDREQWFTDTADGFSKCSVDRWLDEWQPEYHDRYSIWRKATAEEIVEHFKNR